MADTNTELNALKAYMRIDGTDDDEVVALCREAAVAYLANAGVEVNMKNALCKMAVWSLALHYYDHRDAVGTEAPLPTGLRPIINQLKAQGQHYPM